VLFTAVSHQKKSIILAMNITAILLTIARFMRLHSFLSITLSENSAPLEKIFKEIKSKVGMVFFFLIPTG